MDVQTVVNTLWDKIRVVLGDKIDAATDAAAAAKDSETKAKASETAVSDALSTKSDVGHTHAWTEVTGKPTTFAPATHTHAWGEVTGKPTTFTPATHAHAWGEISDKPTTFPPSTHSHAWSTITSKPTTFPPSTHSHDQSDINGLSATLAGKADLVGGVVPTSQIPAVALTKPFTVTSRSAMLALDAQEGDIAVIATGADKGTYMLGDGPKGTFSSWVSLATDPTIPVQSVNGQTGTVVLAAGDVGAAPASHNHPVTDITATGTRGTTTYLRGDGTWATPPNTNTTYALPTQAEAEAGTATTTRVWSAQRVSQAISAQAAPKTHTHGQSEITGLDSALAGKANATHTHSQSQVTGLVDALSGKASATHTHTTAQVTGLDSALAGKANSSHNHPVADITATGTRGTTTYLRGDGTWATPPNTNTTYALPTQAEAEAGTATTSRVWSAQRVSQAIAANAAPKTHTHAMSEVTGLDSALSGKASATHTHTTAQVTGLDSALAGKANSSHTHTTSQITGLDSALSGKADSSHNHPVTDITATGTRGAWTFLRGDGTWATPVDTTYPLPTQAEAEAGTSIMSRVWSAQRVSQAISAQAAPKTHTHELSEITGLTASLDAMVSTLSTYGDHIAGKADSAHKHPVTDITATGTRGASTYLRGDGTWSVPPNTTYSVPTQAEAEAGTSTATRVWSAQRVAQAIAAKAAPKTHTHTMAQISNLPTVSSQHSLNTIAQRDGSGHINVGLAPSQINHAASKFYVDTTRKGVIHSGSGSVPTTIPGAVAGDFWLDTDTMELHKITAV